MIFASQLSAQIENLSGNDSTIYISNTIFLPKYSYFSGQGVWGIVSADFNADKIPDIASISQKDNQLNIHFNDGKGSFTQKKSYSVSASPRDLCTADFNNDKFPDIATISIKNGEMQVFLNDKSGNFTQKTILKTKTFPHDIKAADLDNDGNIDLAIATANGKMLQIAFGNGDGTFQEFVNLSTGTARSIAIGDVNGDNLPDIFVGTDQSVIFYFKNDGNRKFTRFKTLLSSKSPWGLALVDIDKDNDLDLISADYYDANLGVYINNSGSFSKPSFRKSGSYNFDLITGDFDLDGDIDVVTASTRDNSINIHLNNGSGTFENGVLNISGAWNAAITAADFDGDGDIDVATASINDDMINVHRNISKQKEKKQTTACVEGTVYDEISKKPLKTVLSIKDEDGNTLKSMQTTQDGKYKFCLPFGKSYTIHALCPGYPQKDVKIELPKEGLEKDIYLKKIIGTFVFGKVTDKKTGEALVAKIEIKRMKNPNFNENLTTKTDGNYKKELEFNQDYKMFVSCEGYYSQEAFLILLPQHHPNGVEKNFQLVKEEDKRKTCIEGFVIEKGTNNKIPNANMKITDENGNVISTFTSDENGFYSQCVPVGKYFISAFKTGYMFNTEEFELTEQHKDTPLKKDIELDKFQVGKSIVLKYIYYDYNKASLRPESIQELDRLIQIMNENPTLKIEIGGHTDSDGSDAYNQSLSQRRAQSVVDYLLQANIDESRMLAKGYGEKSPIAPNDTDENKQLNRRTEFKILAF